MQLSFIKLKADYISVHCFRAIVKIPLSSTTTRLYTTFFQHIKVRYYIIGLLYYFILYYSAVKHLHSVPGIIPNPDFRGTLLFDVEYLKNDTRKDVVTTDQYWKLESDI